MLAGPLDSLLCYRQGVASPASGHVVVPHLILTDCCWPLYTSHASENPLKSTRRDEKELLELKKITRGFVSDLYVATNGILPMLGIRDTMITAI